MAVSQIPDQTLQQRLEALAKANDVRSSRARLKFDLKDGRRPLDRVLLDPPEYARTMKVIDLLLAAPKIGRVKANGVLNRARISPSKTVSGLSPRQRHELLAVLGPRGYRS